MAMTPEQRRKLSELVGGEVDERGNIIWPDGTVSTGEPSRQIGQTALELPQGTGYMLSSSGAQYDFTPEGVFQGGQQIKQSVDPEFVPNYSMNPVDIGVGEKTWRVRGQPNKFMSAAGTVYSMERQPSLGDLKTQAEIDKLKSEAEKNRRVETANGMPVGLRLKPGEEWIPAEQKVRAVPGSDIYIAQKKKHEDDRDALKAVLSTEKLAVDKVDGLLSDKNFPKLFGSMYSGQLSKYIAPDAQSKLESLKSNLKTAGLQIIRSGGSIGQMTEKEWPIVEQMIDSLTNSLSEEEAAYRLQSIKAHMQRMGEMAREGYQNQWSDTQYFKPVDTGVAQPEAAPERTGNLNKQDMEALNWAMKNPNDPRAVQIKQRLGAQ